MLDRFRKSPQSDKIKKWLSLPETFVLVVLLIFGTFLAFTVPLGAGFDEETHLLRVWEMSAFEWIPNAKLSTTMRFPSFYWDNSYRRQVIIEPIDPYFWKINADVPIDGMGFEQEKLTTRSVYSPLLLLPQSFIMFLLGRVLNLPALTVLIAMRMAGLLCYAFLVWLAVRVAPFGKWMWAVMVISPMAVYQAATIGTDTISNGIGFQFVSCCLYFASLDQINWKKWLILLFLVILLFTVKINLVLLVFLPFFILIPSRFKMKRGFILLAIGTFLFAMVEVGGWNIIAYSRLYTSHAVADPLGQVAYILNHPLSTAWLLITDLRIHLLSYLHGWIAEYGYGYWGPLWFVFLTYLLAIFASFLIPEKSPPQKRTRIGLLLVFGLGFVGTILSMYILINPVGNPEILSVHGRYFTVIFPLLLLGLVGLPKISVNLDRLLMIRITVGISLFSLLLFSTGSYLAYYRRCGAEFYRLGQCYMPVYKNWSPDSVYFEPISPQHNLTQWFVPNCSGMETFRVWIDSSGSDPNGNTEFLLNDEETDIVIYDEILPNNTLPKKGWLNLDIPIDMQSSGKWFSLTVQSPHDEQSKGIRIASSIRAEYIDGPLLQNDAEVENDMIFQYGCIAGWPKLFTRVVSLMNKP